MPPQTPYQLLACALSCSLCYAAAETPASGWWPAQKLPRVVMRTIQEGAFPTPRPAHDFLMQSVAGLAAKSVNTGAGDELVWVSTTNIDAEDWFDRFHQREPGIGVRPDMRPWDLVDHFASQGIIKGYILYRADKSRGELNEHRAAMDCSVNVATSLAGVLDAIIVEEALEPMARQHGLKLLLDARDRTQQWCFETYQARFHHRFVCFQDPRKPHARDLAIAHSAFTGYGYDAPTEDVLQWLTPTSPLLGWNGGDEFKTTAMSSRWGHIQTATDWCMNLPVLMAGSGTTRQSRMMSLDPRTIDWNDRRSGVSFVCTDGDNVQWLEGNFFRGGGGQSYWGSPDRGKIPFGWSCCFAHLSQLCPSAIDYAVGTQTPNDSFIEWGGGYYFPDNFGSGRTNRWELVRAHARQTWAMMQRNGTRMLAFNVARLDSPDALKAYATIAGETDGLLGIFVFQYDRYEAGAGKRFWVKDAHGVDVPVVSARYSIWNHLNGRPRAGTPARVAGEIRSTVENAPPDESTHFDWVIAHAWSWFKPAVGQDESSEDMPQENAGQHGGARGYAPVTWCAARLPTGVRVVRPEELMWRIRMQHDATQTRRLVRDWPP